MEGTSESPINEQLLNFLADGSPITEEAAGQIERMSVEDRQAMVEEVSSAVLEVGVEEEGVSSRLQWVQSLCGESPGKLLAIMTRKERVANADRFGFVAYNPSERHTRSSHGKFRSGDK